MAALDDLKTARDSAAAAIKTLASKLADPTSMSGAGYAKTKQDLRAAVDAYKELDALIAELGGDGDPYFITSRVLTE